MSPIAPKKIVAAQEEHEVPEQNGRSQAIYTRLFAVTMAILVSITSATTGWLLLTTISHGNDITIIKSNRFTVSDAQQVLAAIGELRTQIAKLPTTNDPPAWLISRLDRVEVTMERIEGKFDALREDLATVKNRPSSPAP